MFRKLFRSCAWIIVILLAATWSGRALANGPPIQSETAFVTGLNGAAVRSFAKVVRKSGPGGEVSVFMLPVVVPYELIDNTLVVGIGMPLINKQLRLRDGTERSTGLGIGDLTLFGKVNLFQRDGHQETFRVAGKVALSVPTGVDDASDSLGLMPASLQRGTGSFRPSVTVIVTKLWRRFGLNADLGYTAMTSANDLNPGDLLRYDVAASFRLTPWVYDTYPAHQVNLMVELNGTLAGTTSMAGVEIDDSGGHTLFVSPGVQYMYGGVIVEAALQLPVPGATSLRGALEPDWSAMAGVRWLIL